MNVRGLKAILFLPKITLILGLCALLAIAALTELRPRTFEGRVYDCESQNPVAGAKIELQQQTIFTWDKTHKFYGVSDQQGRFSIVYNIGNTIHVRTSAEKYLLSDEWTKNSPAQIGLLTRRPNDDPTEFSIQCKRSKECFQTRLINGIETTQSICGTYN